MKVLRFPIGEIPDTLRQCDCCGELATGPSCEMCDALRREAVQFVGALSGHLIDLKFPETPVTRIQAAFRIFAREELATRRRREELAAARLHARRLSTQAVYAATLFLLWGGASAACGLLAWGAWLGCRAALGLLLGLPE